MLTKEQIQIRDPFVLAVKADKKYYLYGTTDKNVWEGKATGFDVYASTDLDRWEGPFPAFRPEEGFWADRHYWAPEVYLYDGKYYMFASFKAESKRRGTQILVSDDPVGPFRPHSDGPVTPGDWECLDGTLHVDEAGQPWMVFCHEWLQVQDGEMCAIPLAKDLKSAAGEPVLLFHASDAPWAVGSEDASNGKKNFVTDGPFLHSAANGDLLMLWSSHGANGYAIGIARSDSGDIRGPWVQDREPLFGQDGGHGMLFTTFEGELRLAIHRPNNTPNERPLFLPIAEEKGRLSIKREFSNPIALQRADPWIYKHTDGYYYFTASVPAYDCIELRRARTIQELGSAEPVVIWRKHDKGRMSGHIWAPEIHYIDGKWYIYFAAGGSDEYETEWEIRMYVLENDAANPLEPTWAEKGQLRTHWESFALDATTFEHGGARYLVWAQQGPAMQGTNLYIAEMSNPWTIKEKQVLLSKAEYAWETVGHNVNEGPAVLKRNGKVFISYSASATDSNYCLGLLTALDTSDLLDPQSWTKSPEPVFRSSEVTGQYGPGHNSFTVSEDGAADILVYHARSYKEIVGEPLYDPNRHTRTQELYWNEDGTPNFGIPK
ncbi:GH43 family beta-xylosidase [Paenibacillus harenae]|uniref:GH43 family beta-xylosidase n=1 Tax=Paenibacillus harenae TaxID=306543 RepID=A0ABT9U7D0_PAEHA|nr:GH43 family beta-xylosidase [Paenibacillus harenae]